jgi:hypothetical protein
MGKSKKRRVSKRTKKIGSNPNVIEISGEEDISKFFESLMREGITEKRKMERENHNEENIPEILQMLMSRERPGRQVVEEMKSPLEQEKDKIINELHQVKEMIIKEILSNTMRPQNQPQRKNKRTCGRSMKNNEDFKVFNISLDGGGSCSMSKPSWEQRLDRERPYFSDPLKEGVIAPQGKLLRTLNPPMDMVNPFKKRFPNQVRHQGMDCLCGLEKDRVMRDINDGWSKRLLREQKKNQRLEETNYHLQNENQMYKTQYIRMTPEMMADPLYLHGDQQVPHSLSSSSKRGKRRSQRSSGSC